MQRNLLYWIRIIIPILLLIIAYQILAQGAFPWISVCILFAINLLGIYMLRPIVSFNRQHVLTTQSAFVKVNFELLKAMSVGILIVMLYDYFVRHTLRWETYTGALTAQFVLLLIGLLLSSPLQRRT